MISSGVYDIYVRTAEDEYRIKNYDQALQKLAPIMNDDHQCFGVYYILGKIYQKKKKYDEAEKNFIKAKELNKKKVQPYIRLMHLYTVKKCFDAANGQRELAEVLIKDPSAFVDEKSKQKDIQDYYIFSYDYFKRNKEFDKASEYCDKLLECEFLDEKKKNELRLNKLECLIAMGKNKESEEMIKDLRIKITSTERENVLKLNKMELDMLRLSGKFKEYLIKVETNEFGYMYNGKEYYTLLYYKIVANFHMRNFRKAIDYAKELIITANSLNYKTEMIERHTFYGWACMFYVALCFRYLNEQEKYLNYMAKCKEFMIGEDEEVYLEEAYIYNKNGERDEAIKIISKALRCKANFIPALLLKLNILKSKGLNTEATEIEKKYGEAINEYKINAEIVDEEEVKKGSEDFSISIKGLGEGEKEEENKKETHKEKPIPVYQIIPEIKVLKEIKTGGFGIVRIEKRGNKIFATKYIKEIDEVRRENLKDEVSNNMRFFCKNIVKIEEFSSLSEYPYIVMEYCEGGDLYDLIKTRYNEITPLEKLRICLGIANGLNFIHTEGIVHSDLKTNNVLLKTEDQQFIKKIQNGQIDIKIPVEKLIPKISDFGFSLNRHKEGMEIGKEGELNIAGGSKRYYSKEIVSTGTIKESDDIYSFGLIMRTLFSGKEPFQEKTDNEILPALRNGETPDPDKEIEIPQDKNNKEMILIINAVINQCLSEREKRPTAKGLHEFLNEMYKEYSLV